MSVAVAHRNSQPMPRTSTRTHSPMDSKKAVIKTEDISSKDSTTLAAGRNTPPRSDPPPTVKEPPDQAEGKANVNATTNGETTQPLAPPPRRAPTQQNTAEDAVDYFSTGHHNSHSNSHFSREPNPFEQSFGNPSSEAPTNKSLLPPVAALTSPAPLAGDGPSAGGYNWPGSLRSGPLSPAMLGGPVGAGPGDYFDPSLRGTFPSGVTPNESSLRTGLTPGGGGSMFPAPSPNSQAIYQQLASGSATPSTLDFHRTAMNAKAARQGVQLNANGTSQSEDKRAPVASMDPSLQQQPQQPTFGQHDNDAANGLFLLAQAGNGAQVNNQYGMPNTAHANMANNRSHETSPTMAKGSRNNGSIGGQSEMSGDVSDSGDQGKPATRSRGKRTSSSKNGATNGKRKTEDTPAKQTSTKKQKNMSIDMDGMDSDDEPQPNIKEEQYHADGKKMTDEEKRKNFLERNRHFLLPQVTDVKVAALKCRQRKKQWLANLQAKVEIFSSENDSLSAQVSSLREEIVGLKTLLLQHKDCPVSQSQGLGGYFQQQQDFNPHSNPYGMGMQNGQVMAGQRR